MSIETRTGAPVALGDLLADPRFAQLASAMERIAGQPAPEPEPERLSFEEYTDMNRRRALAWHLEHTPPVYREARATHPTVLAWVDQFLAGDVAAQPSLLLLGTVGTGKTYQCYGALRLIAESGRRPANPISITAADLYDSLRPGQPNFDRAAELGRYAKADLLLIDDLGSAKHSEFTEEVTYRIVNHRYSNALPTLFTTNLRAGDIKLTLGDRVASRLNEMCQKVAFEGQDRRRAR